MSSDLFVPPTLDKWVEGRLSAILTATTQAEFDQAFDNFLAKHVHITVNGAHITRDAYKKQLESEGALNQEAATVKFDGVVVVPTDKDAPKEAGLVGLFFEAVVSEKFLVFGGHAQRKVTSSINVMVEQDKHIHRPEGVIVPPYFDARRVHSLNQVVLGETVPIHPPTQKA